MSITTLIGHCRRRDARLLQSPLALERGRGNAVGPRHLRDDGELLAGRRPRRRGGTAGHARVGGQLEAKPSPSSWCRRLAKSPWNNSHRVAGDLRTDVLKLKVRLNRGR
jgi:hypothetical protein